MKKVTVIESVLDLVKFGFIGNILDNEEEELLLIQESQGKSFAPKHAKRYYEHRLDLVKTFFSDEFVKYHSDYHTYKNKNLMKSYKSHLESIIEGYNKSKPAKNDKLQWLGKPSQFAFIFRELAIKGFIELPLYNGESNFKKIGEVLLEVFEVQKSKSTKNILSEFSRCTLSDTMKAKFTIPGIEDIE